MTKIYKNICFDFNFFFQKRSTDMDEVHLFPGGARITYDHLWWRFYRAKLSLINIDPREMHTKRGL